MGETSAAELSGSSAAWPVAGKVHGSPISSANSASRGSKHLIKEHRARGERWLRAGSAIWIHFQSSRIMRALTNAVAIAVTGKSFDIGDIK